VGVFDPAGDAALGTVLVMEINESMVMPISRTIEDDEDVHSP
jgi:hypothetical protein